MNNHSLCDKYEALAFATEQLIGEVDLAANMNEVLKRCGHAVDACRMRVMTTISDPSDELALAPAYHWISESCEKEFGNLIIGQLRPRQYGLEHWEKIITNQQIVSISRTDANPAELKFLTHFHVQSMIALPIVTHDRIWGMMGVSDCKNERKWAKRDVEFCKSLCRIIAAALDSQELSLISRKGDKHFKSLVYTLPVGVIRTSAKPLSTVQMHNPAASEILGFENAELIATPIASLFDDHDRWRNIYRKLMDDGHCEERECCCIRADGKKVWVTLSPTLIKSPDEQAVFIELVIHNITRRRKAEIDLKNSEAQYRSLVESQSDLIIRITPRGNITFANISAINSFGKTHTELMGLCCTKLVHPDDIEIVEKGIADVISTQGKISVEFRTHTVNGWRWMQWEGYPVATTDTGECEIQTVGRDITDRINAIDALETERHLLRTIIDAIPSCLYMKDRNGYYVLANAEYIRQMGFKDETEIIGKTNYSFQSPERAAHCNRCDNEIMDTGIPVINRQRYWTTTSGVMCCHLFNSAPVRDINGEVIGLIGIITDLSEQKRAEMAAQETQRRYQELIESIPVGACRLKADKRGEVIVANPAAAKMFSKQSEHDMVGFCIGDLFTDPDIAAEIFDKIFTEDQLPPTEAQIQSPDGKNWWGNFTAKLNRDENNQPLHIDIVIENITEQKIAQMSLQQAHNEIVNARETERRHLAREIHDSLGQTIVAMHMNMQGLSLVAERAGLDSESFVQPLRQSAHRCSELVRETRHICQGLYPSALESLGLRAAVEALARDHASHCEISVDFDAELSEFRLSEQTEINLFRIMQEAISNAIKHGKAQKIDISLKICGFAVKLTIIDNGRGFDETIIRGAGLGLKGMRERANAIGAELAIKSSKGSGSEILVVASDKKLEKILTDEQ